MTDSGQQRTPTAGSLEQALAGIGSRARTTDDGRLDPLATVGGWRGILEASLPTFVFMAVFLPTQDVLASGLSALGAAVLLAVPRLVQRQSLMQVGAGVVVVGLCVVMALRSGEARDYFVWGLVTNAVYALGLSLSVVVGWPLVGLLYGLIRGEGLDWRHDPARRRAYARATWVVVVLVFVLRLAVQLPLYLADMVTALGAARLVMGLPLYALALWLAWLVSRPQPGTAPSAASRPSHSQNGAPTP